MEKKCLIYNYAPHYRKDIFMLMDKELGCDFVFGDKMDDVVKMDYALLENFKKEVRNIVLTQRPLTFQIGVLSLLREKYDIFLMMGNLNSLSTWLMLFLRKFFNKKIYLWSHGFYGREGFLMTITKRIFFGLATGTFLYGNYARDLMIKASLNPKKLFVVYNSLSYEKHLAMRSSLKHSTIYEEKFKNLNPNLIFIGRLTPIKRLDLLIKALGLLREQGNVFNLILVGNGKMKETLINLTKELCLEDRVWFYGDSYDENEISTLIFNADVCVSPGNVGLTAIHSMSFGTPVITHDNFSKQMPEFEAVIDGYTGTFFKDNDVNSLANTIVDWFHQHQNREIIRNNCYKEIDTKWNPNVQIKVLKDNLL